MGTVVASVWATKKAEGLGGLALLVVRTDQGLRVAADHLGAGKGDRVLLSHGAGARFADPNAPIDTSVIAILDERGERNVSP